MATSLASSILARIEGSFSNTDTTFGSANKPFSCSLVATLTNGTSAGMADLMITRSVSVSSSGTTYDLRGDATFLDEFGNAVSFVKILGVIIKNTNTTSGQNLIVGNATSNQWSAWCGGATHTVMVTPGGVFLLYSPTDPYAVTAGTGDLFKLAAAGAYNVAVEMIIIGRTA